MFYLSFVLRFLHLGVQSKHSGIREACELVLFLTTALNLSVISLWNGLSPAGSVQLWQH